MDQDDFVQELKNASFRLHYEGVKPLGTILSAAVRMYMSDWWSTVPVIDQPQPVSGEIPWK